LGIEAFELMISLGLAEKDLYCSECHYTWPRREKAKPALDPLGWAVHDPVVPSPEDSSQERDQPSRAQDHT
jgi:hypothetical protein